MLSLTGLGGKRLTGGNGLLKGGQGLSLLPGKELIVAGQAPSDQTGPQKTAFRVIFGLQSQQAA